MNTANPEPTPVDEVVLRREARTALSGRVPVMLAIAIALMTGVLSGYGLRALTAEGHGVRPACPVLVVPPSAIEPGKDCVAGRARLHLLAEEQARQTEESGQCEGARAVKAEKPEKQTRTAAKPAVLD